MISNLLSHPIYEPISDATLRYHELLFNYASPIGPLHGVIDLIYQNDGGDWHIVDWKTEWTPQGEVENIIEEFILQLAVYWMVVEEIMNIEPKVTICLLNPKCITRFITSDELDTIWVEVLENQPEAVANY